MEELHKCHRGPDCLVCRGMTEEEYKKALERELELEIVPVKRDPN